MQESESAMPIAKANSVACLASALLAVHAQQKHWARCRNCTAMQVATWRCIGMGSVPNIPYGGTIMITTAFLCHLGQGEDAMESGQVVQSIHEEDQIGALPLLIV